MPWRDPGRKAFIVQARGDIVRSLEEGENDDATLQVKLQQTKATPEKGPSWRGRSRLRAETWRTDHLFVSQVVC